MHILNTRPIPKSHAFESALRRHYIQSTVCPVTTLRPLIDTTSAAAFRTNQYDYAIFTSTTSVHLAMRHIQADNLPPMLVCVGPETKTALSTYTQQTIITPKQTYSSIGILNETQLSDCSNKRIAIFTNQKSAPILSRTLTEQNNAVFHFYTHNSEICWESLPIIEYAKNIDLTVIFSCFSLHAYHSLLEKTQNLPLYQTPLLVVSKAIQRLAIKQGFTNTITVVPAHAVIETLCNH